MTREKLHLELNRVSNEINNDWVSHWKRIKDYDVVAYTEAWTGGLGYFLASPMAGCQVVQEGNAYFVVLKEPYANTVFYWKRFEKDLPSVIERGGHLYTIDKPTLLGKDQIYSHFKALVEQGKVVGDPKMVLASMRETIQKLVELSQQLKSI